MKKTAEQVDFAIKKEYKKWTCETIHKYCEQFIDCEKCLYHNINDMKVEFEALEIAELEELEESTQEAQEV